MSGIPFPAFLSPEVFSVSLFGVEFALRWYALAYIAGILVGWAIARSLLRRTVLWRDGAPPLTASQLEDLVTWIILGIILGGRLGFVLFYRPGYYLQNPAEIPMVWQGGMAFHGGMLGVVAAILFVARRHAAPVGSIADMLAVAVPPGLLFGRLANFVNAELWGRPTDLPWGVIFPGAAAQDCPGVEGACARHPSQLYEAGMEGLILGALLLLLAYRGGLLKTRWAATGLFLAGYGVARFVVEFFRQADPQFMAPGNPHGYVIGAGEFGRTMGQTLSLPMILAGTALLIWARRRAP